MPEDLRRTIARSRLQPKRRECWEKWAPGAWERAAQHRNDPKPKVRYPVIVGGSDNLAQTAEDVRDLCNLPSVPAVSSTTKAALNPAADQESDKRHVYQIADVSNAQWLDLMERTRGDMKVVWFEGKSRLAWLGRSFKKEGEGESMDDSDG